MRKTASILFLMTAICACGRMDSVNIAEDTESVIAASKAVTDGGIEVIFPCGGNGYPSFWIRDYAMGLDSMHHFSPESVKACYYLIKSTVPTCGEHAYWIPDHINLDGRPVWKAGTYEPDSDAGFGYRASLDGIGFLVRIAGKYASESDDSEFRASEFNFLKEALDSIMDGNLVYVDPSERSVVFGFEDTASFDGNVAYASLQAYESYGILKEWSDIIGLPFDDPRERIKSAFNDAFVVIDGDMGYIRPATGTNKDRFDTWTTAYAVRSGILDSETAMRCAKALLYYKDSYIKHGMAKHVPDEYYHAPGQMWELGDPAVDGTYQSGGYWSTPMADIIHAIDMVSPEAASDILKDAVEYAHKWNYPEVVSEDGHLQNINYVSSVAYVYRAMLESGAVREQVLVKKRNRN